MCSVSLGLRRCLDWKACEFFKAWHRDCPLDHHAQKMKGPLKAQGGVMNSLKTIRVRTTLGDLVSALWEETETLSQLKRAERQLVVAYVLNDLLRKSTYGSRRGPLLLFWKARHQANWNRTTERSRKNALLRLRGTTCSRFAGTSL